MWFGEKKSHRWGAKLIDYYQMNFCSNFHFVFDFSLSRFSFHYFFCIQNHFAPILCGCHIYHSHVSSLWMNYQIICEKVSLWLIQIDTFRNLKIVFESFQWKPFTGWNWIKNRKNESLSSEYRVSFFLFIFGLFHNSQRMCQSRMKFNQICFLFNQNVFCF